MSFDFISCRGGLLRRGMRPFVFGGDFRPMLIAGGGVLGLAGRFSGMAGILVVEPTGLRGDWRSWKRFVEDSLFGRMSGCPPVVCKLALRDSILNAAEGAGGGRVGLGARVRCWVDGGEDRLWGEGERDFFSWKERQAREGERGRGRGQEDE